MPRSHNAALQEGESRFDCIGVSISVHVNLGFMGNRFVFACRDTCATQGERVSHEFIRHDNVHVAAHVLFDILRQCAGLRILSMEEAELAATLPDADNYLFRFLASVDAPSDLFSAYIGFVNLDRAIQLLKGNIFGHRVTDAVTEIPRGAVVDSKHPLKLVSGHSLAGLAKQVGSKKPLSKWQVRIMEDRASRHGELIAA